MPVSKKEAPPSRLDGAQRGEVPGAVGVAAARMSPPHLCVSVYRSSHSHGATGWASAQMPRRLAFASRSRRYKRDPFAAYLTKTHAMPARTCSALASCPSQVTCATVRPKRFSETDGPAPTCGSTAQRGSACFERRGAVPSRERRRRRGAQLCSGEPHRWRTER